MLILRQEGKARQEVRQEGKARQGRQEGKTRQGKAGRQAGRGRQSGRLTFRFYVTTISFFFSATLPIDPIVIKRKYLRDEESGKRADGQIDRQTGS